MNSIKKQMMNFNSSNDNQGHKYDPRPDIKEDHQLWQLLLREAEQVDKQLYSNLHGFRCVGAKLNINDDEMKLISNTDFFNSNDNWQEYRKEFLFPFKNEITALFDEITAII